MRDDIRAGLTARALLTIGVLLPSWRLLTFGVIYVTDDYFASDIFNGELPGRVLVGQMIRQGQWPVWTNQLCSGIPLAGTPADPIGLTAFTLLPPAPALDLFVIVLLLVAAHGAYWLARRFGADRTGAVLAGLAFAGSGYIACQLKHLAIVFTVAWLPVGLALLDRAFTGLPGHVIAARRALCIALFGLVFAEQALAGFPQAVYICGLVYAAFAAFRTVTSRTQFGGWGVPLRILGGIGVATVLGGAAGAVVLLPLSALGAVSDRAQALGWEWSSRFAYWPRNLLTFISPYVNGDISNNSYVGPSIFWEDYGYVGAATVLLAFHGAAREPRPRVVAFLIALTLAAYLLVLGPATPAFRVAYELIPGMQLFRFPTRFLIVVELGLALLAARGLTCLRADLARRLKPGSILPRLIVIAICAATAADLWIHQPRQNPMVSARDWLAAPRSVAVVRGDGPQPRTVTPSRHDLHGRAFLRARGWVNTAPYFELRDVLEPNTGGGFWNVPSADCYAGIAARWHVDLWGDHNRPQSIVARLASAEPATERLSVAPVFPKVLAAYGVSHVLSPYPQRGTALALLGREGHAYIYRIPDAARARFVPSAVLVQSDAEAAARLVDPAFDASREVLLHDVRDGVAAGASGSRDASQGTATGRAVVTREDSRELVIEAEAPQNGFLLLADTYYPGWTAQVDGVRTPIYRANVSVRAISLARGRHTVRFTYEAPGFFRGLLITLLALTVLVLWAATAAHVSRRSVRVRSRKLSAPGPAGPSL
jgi:hypothetical protein